jgi:hypothetical protein
MVIDITALMMVDGCSTNEVNSDRQWSNELMAIDTGDR